jgi:sugar lactone lactonase YvrE
MKNRVFTQNRIIFIFVSVLLVFVIQSVGYAQGRGKIYWTESAWNLRSNTGKIRRANLNGSAVEDIVTGLYGPVDIALDALNRKMYWVDRTTAKIQRANLDGTNVDDIVVKNDLRGLAIDVNSEKIYWGNWCLDIIQRANLDGSDVEELTIKELFLPRNMFIDQLVSAQNIKLDLKAGKLYWTDVFGQKIARANLDGTDAEDLVTKSKGVNGLALDLRNRKMYWSNAVAGKIQRANLNGSKVEDLVTGLSYPFGIALDLRSRKMYWVDWDWETSTGKIQRANLDGSNVTDILTGLNRPSGITLDLDGIYDVTPGTDKLTTTWANVKVQ